MEKLVVYVAVQARKAIWYIEPKDLLGREPIVFTMMRKCHGIVPTGPYCAIDFAPERRKRSRWSYKRDGLEKPTYKKREIKYE